MAPRAVGVVVADVTCGAVRALDSVVPEAVERVRTAILVADQSIGEDGSPQPPSEKSEEFIGLIAESKGGDGGTSEAGARAGSGEGAQAGAVPIREAGEGLKVDEVGSVDFRGKSTLDLQGPDPGVADPFKEAGEESRDRRRRWDFPARGVSGPERLLVEGLGVIEPRHALRRADVSQQSANEVGATQD
ncbi:MAG: hypothetical protein GY714_22415, partial [Desulfobacterales bacterium]|nr:hypothetical protein [Desulfobacterales bacterium]